MTVLHEDFLDTQGGAYKKDVTAESRKTLKFVIPAKAGIQSFQGVEQNHITRFRGKMDFLQ
ncbi:MAG: hypothetical protein EA399_10090 [Desulfovibrionales bacterium]|nr:MAG: hypothetical protein EA399_10090 [Desulfovibrionales bacterium]